MQETSRVLVSSLALHGEFSLNLSNTDTAARELLRDAATLSSKLRDDLCKFSSHHLLSFCWLPLSVSNCLSPVRWWWETSYRIQNKIAVHKSKLVFERTEKEDLGALIYFTDSVNIIKEESRIVAFILEDLSTWKILYKNLSHIRIGLNYTTSFRELQITT